MEGALIATLAFIQFINVVDFMIIMPLGPVLMKIYSCGPQQFSWLVSSCTFAAALAGFMGPLIVDRFGRKVLLRTFFAGVTLGTLFCGLAPNYWAFLAARIVTGAMAGLTGAMIFTIIGEVIPAARRGRAVGQLMLALSLAATFGVPIGLFLSNRWGWHAPFFILSGLSVMVQIMIERFVPELKDHLGQKAPQTLKQVYKNVLGDPIHQRALLFSLIFFSSHFMIIPFISTYLVANAGLQQDQLFWIYLTGGLANTMASPIIGRIVDRFGPKPVFTVFNFLSVIPVLMITHLGPSPLGIILACGVCLFIISNGRMIPSLTLVNLSASPKERASYQGLVGTVQSTSIGVSAWIGGMIVETGPSGELLHYPYLGFLSIAMSFLGLALIYKISPRTSGSSPDIPLAH